jgi:nicotinamide/nicotinate riboside kinase
VRRWKDSFEQLELEMKEEGKNIVWGIVDGFLLYWNKVRRIMILMLTVLTCLNQGIIDQLDVRVLLRLPHDMLKKRRDERHAYHNASKKISLFLY